MAAQPVDPPKTPMQEAFTWIWETFGEPLVKGGITWGWKVAQWKLAADRYAERLEQDYGKLFVLGQPEPRDIDDIYTYVNVLEEVSAYKRYGPEQLHELFIRRGLWHDKKERRDGVKMVQTGKNLFILGQPGAGKTTFLKQVTIRAARGQMIRTIDNQLRLMLPESVQERLQEMKEVTQIPVFISLKEHADSERTLLESVEHELQVCRFPDAAPFVQLLLKSGRALVLWDGLDEVSQDENRRDKLIGEMREFMRQYRETQFVITCRVAATEYSFDNVDYLEMADFEEGQMNTFIHRWFNDRKLADQCRMELQKPDNKGLCELARNPLLLTLLVIAYEETLTFPQRQVEIYEEAIDALLKKWDSKRRVRRGEEPYKALSLGRKRQMLARIGAETFGKGEFILPQRRLAGLIEAYMQYLPGVEDYIDGEVILRAIAERHGIFVERAHKLYSFAHLSFQEYFAAKFIVDHTRQESLERLLEHVAEDQWQELFLLTASLLNEADADDFFGMFVDRLNEIAADVEPIQQYLVWVQKKGEQALAAMKPAYCTLRK